MKQDRPTAVRVGANLEAVEVPWKQEKSADLAQEQNQPMSSDCF